MTSNYTDFFKDNPWEDISIGSYPSSARRLYIEDSRFWVSVNSDGSFLFYVEELGFFDFDVLNRLDCLSIHLEHIGNKTRLICILNEVEMFDKFRTIAKDVAAYSSGYSSLNLFRSVISRIYSWSEFLKPSRSGLGFRELIGFWGELFIFLEYFVTSCGPEKALKAWSGPENKKQDFTFDNTAFEVKTKIIGDNNNIKISALEQLQRITDGLYLIVFRINESIDEFGISLDDLVNNFISSIGDNEFLKTAFLQKIVTKYGKARDDELNRKFTDISFNIYEITSEFPRIVPENLPHEKIQKVSYTIDGNALETYEVTTALRELIIDGSTTSV